MLSFQSVPRRARDAVSSAMRALIVAGAIALGFCAPTLAQQAIEPAQLGTPTGDERTARTPDLQTLLRDYPISPPDTTSPRASLESFMVLMAEANRVWRQVRDDFRDSGNAFMSDEEERRVEVVRLLISKAREIFDLGDVPETARTAVGVEIVLQFQEILDRIFLPPLDEIPGERAGSFLHAKEASDLPERWTIPGTSIVFQRSDASKGDLKYLISRETVDRIPDDYESVKMFPSRSDRGEDFYEYYIYTPGYLVAPRWYDLILAGPDWLRNQFMSQAYWQWAALLLLLGVAVSIPVMLQRWNRWRAVPLSEVHRRLRGFQQPLLQLIVVIVFRYLVDEQINITGAPMIAIGTFSSVVMWVSLAWLAYQSVDLLASYVTKNPAMPTASLDSSLLLSAFRLFGLAFAIITLGYGATRIGIPIYGVIAGLGVGGLAVALAAQPTLENLIGGVILYADRMVRVGEYCEFEGFAGTVEAIGIRSTRLRALDRTLITVANSDLAKRKIVNFSRRDRFLFRHTVGLRYETSRDQVISVVRQIHDCFTRHPKVLDHIALRVSLVGYGSYSIDVEVFSYISTSDRDEFLMIQEDLLLEIGRIVKENGSDFAFPSNVTYLGRDAGLPGEKKSEATTRSAGTATYRGDRSDELTDVAAET